MKTSTKIIFFQGLFCLLLLGMVPKAMAQTHAEKAPAPSYATVAPAAESADAMWDIQFDYDISAGPNLQGLAGAIHIGNEFWVSVWSSDTLVRYENDGTFIEKFAMPALFSEPSGGVRGMTWDGTSIWAANNTSTIYQIDPATKAIISQVNVVGTTETVRFITYDATADGGNGGFWIANFNTDITLIRMNGTFLSNISSDTHQLGGMYGAAIDNDSPGGPYLWVFHQADNPSNSIITQLSTTTGLSTGIARDVNIDLGTPEALAGGLFISKDWDPNGGMILGGVNQTTPDRLFGYELDFIPGPNIDLGTNNLTSPQTGCELTDAEIVTFEIVNPGVTSVTDIPLELFVNGTSVQLDTFMGTLAAGASTVFTFSESIDLSVPGNYVIGVRTALPTDINNANDLTNWNVGSKAFGGPPVIEDFDGFPTGTVVFPGLYNTGVIPF
ncbi:MAG: hypothetical protein AAGD05_16605, partial [Bacteroidota bacterium]